jgi:hypothetical protein
MKTQTPMKTQTARLRRSPVRQASRQISLAEQDWFRAIVLWLILEALCVGVAPYFGWIEPGDRWQTWVMISIPAGLVGSLLIGLSSQSAEYLSAQQLSLSKQVQVLMTQVLGGVGLSGILLPLAMAFIEFTAKAVTEIMQRVS